MKKLTSLGVLLYILILLQSCGYCPKWQTETVDGENSSVGKFTSLALDSNGNPHITYYDEDNKKLKYAYQDINGWHLETIDDENPVHGRPSIVLDKHNMPHVCYNTFKDVSINTTEFIHDVKYAYKAAAGWHIETAVDNEYVGDAVFENFEWYTSLAIDGEGNLHISDFYYRCDWPCSRSGPSSLKYIHKHSSAWQSEVVDSSRDDMLDYVGEYNALTLDADNRAHISYSIQYPYEPELTSESLNYAYLDTAGWHKEVVDSGLGIGTYNAIAVDSSKNPHISYYDNGNKRLKYVYRDAAGWHIETVDNNGEVGKYTSIAFDSKGKPHISYYDESNKDLKYAFKDSSVWHLETVDSTGDVGSFTAIALDAKGNPHISYYDATNKDLKYAYWGY